MESIKSKNINILLAVTGVVVIILWLLKVWQVSGQLPVYVVPLELLSMLLLLSIFYYFFASIRVANKKITNLLEQNAESKIKHEQRESHLLQKIMQLEEGEKEKEIFNAHKQKTINRIVAKIDKSNTNQFKASIVPALASVIESVTAIGYWYDGSTQKYVAQKTYGIELSSGIAPFEINEGFSGQAVAERKLITLDDIPEDYFNAESGLGSHRPKYIYFAPLIIDGNVEGLLEIGSFKKLDLANFWSDLNQRIDEIYKSLN